jgi:hypothetical protein
LSPCSAPLSWLRLERYALGELDSTVRSEVRIHVEGCAWCGDHLRSIEIDPWRLAPLPEVKRPTWSSPRFTWAVPLVALAALTLFFVLPDGSRTAGLSARARIKGGELAISLVRERQGETLRDPRSHADGDRFKVLVTCPPGDAEVRVLVSQEGQVVFPFGRDPIPMACGNGVPIEGAFQATGGGDLTVCITLGETTPRDLRDLSAETAVCTAVAAEGAQ